MVEVVGTCKVCGGNIVKETYLVRNYDVPIIYGPGSRHNPTHREQYKYYCAKCGILYEFVPE